MLPAVTHSPFCVSSFTLWGTYFAGLVIIYFFFYVTTKIRVFYMQYVQSRAHKIKLVTYRDKKSYYRHRDFIRETRTQKKFFQLSLKHIPWTCLPHTPTRGSSLYTNKKALSLCICATKKREHVMFTRCQLLSGASVKHERNSVTTPCCGVLHTYKFCCLRSANFCRIGLACVCVRIKNRINLIWWAV